MRITLLRNPKAGNGKHGRKELVNALGESRSPNYLSVDHPLPIRRFKKLKIVWQRSAIHFDDETWPQSDEKPKRPVTIKIKVKSSALRVLRP